MIEHMCVLSTRHIDAETARQLEAASGYRELIALPGRADWVDALILYPHGEYGWLIYIPDQFDADLPDSLEACMALARANKCPWLLLDRDGEPIDQLPTYEW